MKKNNFKITHGIIILGIISLVTTLVISSMAYFNMRNLNDNIEKLYSHQLKKVEVSGAISDSLGQLRNALTKIIDRSYNQDIVNSVKENDRIIKEKIQSMNEIPSNEEEKDTINKLKTTYDKYIKDSEIIISKKSKNESIDTEFANKYGEEGEQLSKLLNELRGENIKSAEDLFLSSKESSIKTTKIFMIIIILAILLISSVMTLIYKIIKNSIKEFIDTLKILSTGDFTVEIDRSSSNEFGIMQRELALTVDSISNMIRNFKNSTSEINEQSISLYNISDELSQSTDQVSRAISEVAKGSEGQANELSDINASVNNFAESIDNITLVVKDVLNNSNDINNISSNANNQLMGLITSLDDIQKLFESVSKKVITLGVNIERIEDITNLINNIADQTNLLALNAAIEAARAGESGRGFAVVADEIRTLAEQSKNFSDDIKEIVNLISGESNQVVESTKEVSISFKSQGEVLDSSITSFKEIIEAINASTPLINKMNSLVYNLNSEKETIIYKVENIASVSEENAASSEEILASSEEINAASQKVSMSSEDLSKIIKDSIEEINKFKI